MESISDRIEAVFPFKLPSSDRISSLCVTSGIAEDASQYGYDGLYVSDYYYFIHQDCSLEIHRSSIIVTYLLPWLMTFKFQKRRGIGNVITTLIILIASVVLGAGVIFFGGSMFQTNTQSESLKVTNVHSWVNPTTDVSVTAFAVQNTGSKPITINSISLRGLPVPTSSWYSLTNSSLATQTNVNTELTVDYDPSGGVTLASGAAAMTPGAISLAQGGATIVYVLEAGNINAIDAGNTYSLQIQAGQATAVQQVQVVSAT
ncbi:MAG TPA: hypothetical protein VD736_03320 [Nitrososphaera sp.]|nr:hypothetical protein [Nitrososphaera sp.]